MLVNEPLRPEALKQAVQNPRGGGVRLVDVPMPKVSAGHVLVDVRASLISAGTERMVTAFAEKSLLGKAKSVSNSSDETLMKIGFWVGENPGYRVRIYRTAAGFRVLIVNATVLATSAQAEQILEGLESDPLYRQLCRVQECFRARLTPKPWRIRRGRNPPNRFPWTEPESEQAYRDWESKYERAASSYRTCQFIEEVGAEEYQISDTHRSLIELHDELTGAHAERPLA